VSSEVVSSRTHAGGAIRAEILRVINDPAPETFTVVLTWFDVRLNQQAGWAFRFDSCAAAEAEADRLLRDLHHHSCTDDACTDWIHPEGSPCP